MTIATTIIYDDFPGDSSSLLPEIKAPLGHGFTSLGVSSARIVPLSPPGQDAFLRALCRAGLIRWSGKRLKPISPVAEVRGEKGVADLIIEDRR